MSFGYFPDYKDGSFLRIQEKNALDTATTNLTGCHRKMHKVKR